MVPSQFVQMDDMPLTTSGKVNRKALPEPLTFEQEDKIEAGTEIETEELSDTQTRILQIWSNSIKKKNIGINDNFFNIGGNSLLAILVAEKIEKEFGTSLNLRVFFDGPTILLLLNILIWKLL